MLNCKTIYIFFFSLFCMVGFADDLNFIAIDGKSFTRKDNFNNLQTVTIDSFMIADRMITIEEWSLFLSETKPDSIKDWKDYIRYSIDDNYYESGIRLSSDLPAFCITWYEIIEYCNWRSKRDGLTPVYSFDIKEPGVLHNISWDKNLNGYRLPTEAEWELSSGIYTGTATVKKYLMTGEIKKSIGTNPFPRNIMELPPNDLGLYDMFGIVLQYCWDYYQDEYYLTANNHNPNGPDQFYSSNSDFPEQEIRVARGGAWWQTAFELFKHPRNFGYARWNTGDIGIRLAKNCN